MSESVDDKTINETKAVMSMVKDEVKKALKELSLDGSGEELRQQTTVLVQVVQQTWSQLHQAAFNKYMLETQVRLQGGGGLSLPRSAIIG